MLRLCHVLAPIRLMMATAMLLPGCAASGSKTSSTGDAQSSPQAQWQAQNIDDYSFTLHVDCFCIVRGPIHLVVRDGQLHASLIELEQRALKDHELDFTPTTISALFDLVEHTREQPDSTVEVEFAEDFGYPSHIVIDKEKMAFDGGRAYRISDFTVE